MIRNIMNRVNDVLLPKLFSWSYEHSMFLFSAFPFNHNFSEGSNIVFNYLLQKTNITPPTYIVLCQDDNASVYYKIWSNVLFSIEDMCLNLILDFRLGNRISFKDIHKIFYHDTFLENVWFCLKEIEQR